MSFMDMNRATNGNAAVSPSAPDKSKDWQLEILMEKLRSKSAQFKTMAEISKNVRMAILDKRYPLDSVEKSHHQKCLDTLQHSIKVTSLQSMIERLESLTRQLGLKFMVGPSGVELFISSDMFYLEIVLDQTGAVKDVKVHHESKMEQQSCSELVNCLSRRDFADFTAQLEGFASIYQLNAEKKIKCKAFTALQSLESDLSTLAQLQSFMKEPFNLLHKSPVGILEKRRGGHPMKLTYFVSPYDLLNVDSCDIDPITIDVIVNKSLGYSVTVCMEGSAAHKLQTTTLITVNRNVNGKSTPSFSSLNSQNSAAMPACFVLKLNEPMPMCLALIRQIQQLTELDSMELGTPQPLLNLIVNHTSNGKMESGNNKGLFVTLPDQNHCYFMTENKNMDGVLITSIPFTHPAHVSQLLVILRQQALFNTIISSCVRPNSKQDFDNMTMFEVSALSWSHISLSLEHPLEESMATAEIDLSDISNLSCKIKNPGTVTNGGDSVTDLSTKILNRCFSIPVTMRSVIKLWERQVSRRNHYNGHENFSLPLGSGDPGGHNKGPSSGGSSEFGGLIDGTKIKQEPTGGGGGGGGGVGNNSGNGMMMHNHQFLNDSINFQSDGMLTSIELTNILQGSGGGLMQKKIQKPWKNRKKLGDDDLLVETSSSDSTSRSTPVSQETELVCTTSNSGLGFHSDLELSGLDPAELLMGTSSDKISTHFDNLDELGDVEEMLAGPSSIRRKSRDQKSPTSLMLDLGEKNLVPPSVSITPIVSNAPSYMSQGGNPEKRPGIEIIPLATSAASALPSSITITAITSSKSDDRNRDKKSGSRNRSDDRNRLEKKRKRKRDESPMGPPEKVPPKQDPLTKPVTVSIKPAESPPLPMSTPTSPVMMRKFNTSPSLSGKLSPNLIKPTLKSSHSPKHSPGHVSSSPKHGGIVGISSPKSHGTSPKHPSTSGSGKPSMSTLKSAANSPSSKSSSSATNSTESKSAKNVSGKESSRSDKDKKLSGGFQVFSVGKTKSSVKVKPLDLNMECMSGLQDGLPSPGADLSKGGNPNQVRNRKGSLSAIVDKLKSAQHCDIVTDLSSTKSGNGGNGRQLSAKVVAKTGGDGKNSEYMIKPSSDSMKITINKTRTKDSTKSGGNLSKSGSGSPKTHTGLKPGVNSGPASKKPQQIKLNSTSAPSAANYVKSNKMPSGSGSKIASSTNSSKSQSSKLIGSPKSATDLSRNKERPVKLNKTGSDNKSIFTSKDGRKSSPTQQNSNDGDAYKAPLMMEGLMKHLDKNFQIPKLSARTCTTLSSSSTTISSSASSVNQTVVDDKKVTKIDIVNNVNRTIDAKIFDLMTKTDPPLAIVQKFPIALPVQTATKPFENSSDSPKVRNNVLPLPGLSPKVTNEEEGSNKKQEPQNLIQPKDVKSIGAVPIASTEPLSLSNKSIDLTSKFVAPAPKDDALASGGSGAKTNTSKDVKKTDCGGVGGVGDGLLDFSSGATNIKTTDSVNKSTTCVNYPQSPSVSVHIVKSPAPSPLLINPSPHAASPCITDDELMDEALIGLGK